MLVGKILKMSIIKKQNLICVVFFLIYLGNVAESQRSPVLIDNTIRPGGSFIDSRCVSGEGKKLRLVTCDGNSKSQQWIFKVDV